MYEGEGAGAGSAQRDLASVGVVLFVGGVGVSECGVAGGSSLAHVVGVVLDVGESAGVDMSVGVRGVASVVSSR